MKQADIESNLTPITVHGRFLVLCRELLNAEDDSPRAQMLLDREEALGHVITTLAAENLTDAAHQLGAVYMLIDRLHAMDVSAENAERTIEEMSSRVYRSILSVLPVVAQAACLTLGGLELPNLARFRAALFERAEP